MASFRFLFCCVGIFFFLASRVCFWSQVQIQVKLGQQRDAHAGSLLVTSFPSYVSGRTGTVNT